MKGKIDHITEIKELSSGTRAGKTWKLWGATLTVDGNDYGYSDFEKKALEEKVAKLKIGSMIEFETEERGQYTNVKPKTEVKVLQEGTGRAGPAPPAPKITAEETNKVWAESADSVLDYFKKKKIKVDDAASITSSINTLFMDKMKEKRKR